MTQARDLLPLRLELVPMQLPSGPIEPVGRAAQRSDRPFQNTLAPSGPNRTNNYADSYVLLYPGESSELLVRLKNHNAQTVQINAQLEGNFPAHWCRFRMEGNQVPAKGQIEGVLYFQLPGNFFESNDTLVTHKKPLTLDFYGQIHIEYSLDNDLENSPLTITQSGKFSVFVRPRSLYLDFLPELYREVDFIGRLLKIFEQGFEPAVNQLESLWAYLDPLTAPEMLLPFLSHWVGWKMDARLSLTRQRYLIRQAIKLFHWRGTRRGLRLYLHLYTDLPLDEHLPEEEKHISIQEIFTQGFVLGFSRLGDDAIVGGGRPYHFLVRLRPEAGQPIDEGLVREIIEQEKPAFCTYELFIDSPN
jgi:phage tail-like protein